MKTNLFRISNGFATNSGLPVAFTAAALIETPKAVYVYGAGEADPQGACARCGRALTHPGSILIGIGPECLKDWGARDVRLDNLSDADIKHLKSLITSRIVNSWIPKSCIQTVVESTVEIIPPKDHPMLLPKSTKKTAELVTYKNDQSDAIKIIFPYNVDDLAKVKSLPGRRFHNEGMTKYWTCPCSPDTIEALQNWGFQISPELLDILIASKTPKTELKEFSLYFSLCPLYYLNGYSENNLNQGENYAKRNLQTKTENTRTDRPDERELQKRQITGSTRKSNIENKRECKRPRMEKESLRSNKKSNALPNNSTEAFRWAEESKREIWNKFQRREWSGTDSDYQTCQSIILSMWIHKGISNPNKTNSEQLQKCSRCLQSRLCQSGTNACNRNGWDLSSSNRTEEERREENKNPASPWLDCNSIAALQSVIMIPGLQKGLFRFQLEDVFKMEKLNGNILNASEMGLGKTAQALAWLQLHPELRPAVVVVPASLKLNWKKEAEMWMSDPKVQVLSGTKATLPIVGEIIVINYDILSGWLEVLKGIKAKVLILDEVHYTKNQTAKRTKAVKMLKKSIPHLIALSGTPIINRPIEAFTVLSMLDPGNFPSAWKYAMRYCGAKNNGFGWDFTGSSHTDELHKKLTDGKMIRRMKADVLTDLPDKIRSFTPVELKNEKNYRKAESNFITYIREMKGNKAAEKAKGAEHLVQIETLKQVSVQEKLPACIEWIKDFLEVNGHKLVLFANHKFVIDELMAAFPEISVKIDGSVSPDKRQGVVDAFQTNPKIRLFIGNIKAAGVGLTLTAASTVAFIELPWAPGELDQAEDRCHRIGQKNNVNIHYLLAPGTIEDRIAQLLDSKRNVIGQVLDGKEDNGESMFKELIASYKED